MAGMLFFSSNNEDKYVSGFNSRERKYVVFICLIIEKKHTGFYNKAENT